MPSSVGGTGRYLCENLPCETRHWWPPFPVNIASPGCACTTPSGVRTVQATSVKRTSTSRSNFLASTCSGFPETSVEYPLFPLQRNINSSHPLLFCSSPESYTTSNRRYSANG